jgi:TM2 domain-containing membrane protein YozV
MKIHNTMFHCPGKPMSQGQGSTGNVIAALCSLFVPGLGQLIQGRLLSALFWFIAACIAFACCLSVGSS